MPVLTPQRLATIANTLLPNLQGSWYIVASTLLASCNKSREIPKVYHLLVQQSLLNSAIDEQMALKLIKLAENRPETIQGFSEKEALLTRKVQESLLKLLIITGVPRLINSLALIKETVPVKNFATEKTHRDFTGASHTIPTVLGSDMTRSARGNQMFSTIYNKVTSRVLSNLWTDYPDLHDFILSSCYGEILSFDEILDTKSTSLLLIGLLVPQDVNLQLKGHLRGALNVGNSRLESNEARDLALQIARWSGIELTEEPWRLT